MSRRKNVLNHRIVFVGFFLTLLTSLAFAQAAWWEPERPLAGQPVTIHYDTRVGTLPPGAPVVRLHWGILNPLNGNWLRPPTAMWPTGSVLQSDSVAVQSPMVRNTADSTFTLTLTPPDTTIHNIAFVFTTGTQWDNNNNRNWNITWVNAGTVAWWSPDSSEPGDAVTIYYNAAAGTLPTGSSNILLHWGINQTSPGAWIQPPSQIWPPNTVPSGTGAAQSRLTNNNGIWSTTIQTNDTIRSLHFVFTNGTQWDNNNGLNWDIWLTPQIPPVLTWHTFTFDTRAAAFISPVAIINRVNVAGSFNNWSATATRLTGPDSLGIYQLSTKIASGSHEYKYVLNGSYWINDPENPRYAPGGFHNNVMFVELDSLPFAEMVSPVEGFPLPTLSNLPVQFNIQPGCYDTPIRWNPPPTLMMNGSPVTVTAVPDSGILRASVNVAQSDVRQTWTLTITDTQNRAVTRTWQTWLNQNLAVGANWLDRYNDTEQSLPANVASSVDLTGLNVSHFATGDSLQMTVGLNRIGDSTRVLLHIGSEISGEVVSTAGNGAEVGVLEWNGAGVEVVLCHPNSPTYSSAIHNKLITQREPFTVSNTISVAIVATNEMSFSVRIALSDLEAVLGSWNRPWYFGAFSYLGGTMRPDGDAIEVPANWGGDPSDLDPDALDVLVAPGRGLQTRMLRNWSGNRLAALDGRYRGFLRVNASELGINRSTPFVQMLSRGTDYTVRPNWTLTAVCSTSTVTARRFYQNGVSVPFTTTGDTIRANVVLAPGTNTFYAEADNASGTGRSSSILYQYRADQGPNVVLNASINGNTGTLDASGTTDPTPGDQITYLWSADSTNPAPVTIQNANQAVASFSRPSVNGEYYFKVTATDQQGNVRYGKTFFRVWTDGWNAFSSNEAAWWLNDVMFYEIFPRNYSANGGLQGVTADLDRIRALGFNALWLTPIFPGPSEHGYAITDYFGIEEDYGTEADFRELMRQAKLRGMRVILDLVANHTSIEHPYMRDAQRFGRFSPYWDFFDRDANGRYTYYFDWTSLPNVNSNNPDVIDHFIRASKYWMEEYGVDGFRCDVAWGPQNRNSNFWIQWRNELKKIRPDCFLLAEADASTFTFFENRFDAAMDWNLHHSLPGSFQNMFPGPPAISDVVNALTNFGIGYPGYKYPFRFMENFDEVRYISVKTPEQTRTAATLLLTANQMPMIYAGQELGMTSQRGTIDWGSDPNHMINHYVPLLYARANIPALRVANFEQLTHNSGAPVLCYGRNLPGQTKAITMVNFSAASQIVSVNVPASWNLEAATTYYVNDLLANTRYTRTGAQLTSFTTSLNIHGSKVYVISTEAFIVDAPEPSLVELPVSTQLGTLYPNPFNATLRIPFTLAQGGEYKLAVFDILGRQVKTIAAGKLRPGFHSVMWNGTNDNGLPVSSGNYFVRLVAPDHVTAVKKVALLR